MFWLESLLNHLKFVRSAAHIVHRRNFNFHLIGIIFLIWYSLVSAFSNCKQWARRRKTYPLEFIFPSGRKKSRSVDLSRLHRGLGIYSGLLMAKEYRILSFSLSWHLWILNIECTLLQSVYLLTHLTGNVSHKSREWANKCLGVCRGSKGIGVMMCHLPRPKALMDSLHLETC